MITLGTPTPDLSTLADFALGNLSPEESLKIVRELERNPQASRDLEFILKLIAHFEEQRKDTPKS